MNDHSVQLQPMGANEAEISVLQVSATIAALAGTATAQVQCLPDSFFCLMGYLGSTNYDGIAGQWKITNVAASAHVLYGPPIAPNNFSVFIQQDNNVNFSGAQLGIPQAAICGNGYRAGNQLPFPVLYRPMTQFQFTFTNTAQVLLDDSTGSPGAAVSLQIYFGMFGYNIPTQNLSAFLCAWPSYLRAAEENRPNWLRKFTGMAIPGMT